MCMYRADFTQFRVTMHSSMYSTHGACSWYAHSPIPIAVMSGEEGGDCFLVERYESDIEEEGGASASSHTPKKVVKGEKQLMLVISERFLEEKSSMGDKVKYTSSCTNLVHLLLDPFIVCDIDEAVLYSNIFFSKLVFATFLYMYMCIIFCTYMQCSLWINGT